MLQIPLLTKQTELKLMFESQLLNESNSNKLKPDLICLWTIKIISFRIRMSNTITIWSVNGLISTSYVKYWPIKKLNIKKIKEKKNNINFILAQCQSKYSYFTQNPKGD
jgi:hypothetical protein